jgi:ADP-heptose:LPS heptosyltransferase
MLGLSPASILPRLALPHVSTDAWDPFPHRPRVILSPVSPWPHKRWPDRAFVETAQRVHRETGAAFVVAGGPGEEDQLRTVAAGLAGIPHGSRICSRIRDLAGLLRESDVFLGNDNGPRHVAIALGVPTLGYFSEVNPVHWTPPGPLHPVLWDLAHAGGRSVPSDRTILPPHPETAARAVVDLLEHSRVRTGPIAAGAPSGEGNP